MNTHPSTPSFDRKDLLICPECGHESPVSGDWIVLVDVERERFVCPDCETTITTRPSTGSARPTESVERIVDAGAHNSRHEYSECD